MTYGQLDNIYNKCYLGPESLFRIFTEKLNGKYINLFSVLYR